MSKPELLACPFCGHDDSLLEFHDPQTILHPWYRIECDYCGAKGPGSDHGDHREHWNRRAPSDKPEAQAVADLVRADWSWRFREGDGTPYSYQEIQRTDEGAENLSATCKRKGAHTVTITPLGPIAPPPSPDLVAELRKLTDDERYRIFSQFCAHCGSTDTRCQCWNDE